MGKRGGIRQKKRDKYIKTGGGDKETVGNKENRKKEEKMNATII